MPNHIRIYDDLDGVFVEKLKRALTEDVINMADWVDDLAAWIAQFISQVPDEEQPSLHAFAHEGIDYHMRPKEMP